MVGIIPCAGQGTRLGLPFPKELLPDIKHFYYYPIMQYTLDGMIRAGIQDIIVTLSPQKNKIMEYLGNGKKWGISISYVVHPEPISLPHSIIEAKHLIKNSPIMFGHPDTVIKPDQYFVYLKNAFDRYGAQNLVLGCFRTQTPEQFGVLKFNEDFIVEELDEKPKSNVWEWMWGPQIWPSSYTQIMEEIVDSNPKPRSGNKELDLTDIMLKFRAAYGTDSIRALPFAEGTYTDLGTYKHLLHWMREMRD